MAKLPAFQFYPADWRKDPGVQALTFHDRGVWFEILCLLHESQDRGKLLLNGNPMPDDALARLLGLDKQVLTNTLAILLSYGVASRCPDTGALMSRRMVRDEEIREIRKEAGKKGGNPNLLNQNANQNSKPLVKQKSTPSSSITSSSSITDLKEEVTSVTSKKSAVDECEPDAGNSEIQTLVNEWNMLGEPFAAIRRLTDARTRSLKQRLKEPHWRRHWREGLEKLKSSAFCKGEGTTGWKADFDWFIKPDSLTKLLEGKYDSSGKTLGIFNGTGTHRRLNSGQIYDPATADLVGNY